MERKSLSLSIDTSEEVVYQKTLNHLSTKEEYKITINLNIPGVYAILISTKEDTYYKSPIIFHKVTGIKSLKNETNPGSIIQDLKFERDKDNTIYCTRCLSKVYPMEPGNTESYIYKNYIPFKEFIDIEKLGMDHILDFITGCIE